MERYAGDNETIIGYCAYCKEIIREGEGHVCIHGKYYHYDPVNYYKNCFFPEEEDK